jgi:sialate O-acetylesterase
LNIHPLNKQDVGLRLALSALRGTYGMDVAASGPCFRAARREGNAVRVFFDHTGDGLVSRDGEPRGFAIAGEDDIFASAQARIEGGTVVVSSPSVADPRAVRYAWADNPACNLYNAAGLPAVPFRSPPVQ